MTGFPIPDNYVDHILVASPSTVRQRVLESLRSPVRRFEQATGGAEALVHLESGFWQVLFLESPPNRPRRRGTEPDRQAALSRNGAMNTVRTAGTPNRHSTKRFDLEIDQKVDREIDPEKTTNDQRLTTEGEQRTTKADQRFNERGFPS